MKQIDTLIQRLRIRAAMHHIPKNAHVLDIGCHRGELFESVPEIQSGLGLDPLCDVPSEKKSFRFVQGLFPADMPDSEERFDAIVALAVFEHVPPEDKEAFSKACCDYLSPGGRVIITVPSKRVDAILKLLLLFRLIDGMSLEEHHGFEPSSTPDYFLPQGMTSHHTSTFEFGLNHIFVFVKDDAAHG